MKYMVDRYISGPSFNDRMAPTAKRGFSLMELLVVITIIAILASILMPLIPTVRSMAKRSVCMSNQRQLFLGFSGWAIDHENVYPETCHHAWGLTYRSPAYLLNDAEAAGYPKDLSMVGVAPYMDTTPQNGLHRAWGCPELGGAPQTSSTSWNNVVYWEISYCYYSGISAWSSQASMPNDLVDNKMDPNRLILSCKFGWVPGFSAWDGYDPTTFRGMNELSGDGHVAWKKASDFNLTVIKSHLWDPSIKMIRWFNNDFLYY